MILRNYQEKFKNKLLIELNSSEKLNILFVLPTGAGKTIIFSNIVKILNIPTCLIAHRDQILSQISLALAAYGIYHNIIGNDAVIKVCIQLHIKKFSMSYFDYNSNITVASVDTLTRRNNISEWASKIKLWVQDEAHHVLKDNKWGKACKLFPNAKGLGVTATPKRCDGLGLGMDNDGLFHKMIVGESMSDLIKLGYLTDYDIYVPPNDMHLERVDISRATGEFNQNQLKQTIAQSYIVGDIVSHYKKIAYGKLGATFAPNMEIANKITDKFNSAGVPAKLVNAKTPTMERYRILDDFRDKKILQLVNVDLFGEGFDLPALEVISMARPTMSLPVYQQQCGRAFRPFKGKDKATIIDHVGNVMHHNVPDAPQNWSLERTRKFSKFNDLSEIKIKTCDNCFAVYNKILGSCPYCSYKPVVSARNRIKEVEGDLTKLTLEQINELKGDTVLKTED